MKDPYKKFASLQLFMTVLSVVFGGFAIAKGYYVLVFLALITLSLSFVFEGIIDWKKQRIPLFLLQMIRALIIVTFAFYLYFRIA
ncbi:hypothetical protein KO561_17700 [Radiobacillus kanasensis]|uniref:hypothetical protein n=1 Tax=Radiobacillus kanasensis TaxID=2844358 RepID=UPI001E494224|nr:hypothetical protein [Radiobacillus kanasensis]UFT98999.1 hypothetical protein KO561_17700 [Radiobacillus kanasensis]